MNKIIFFLFFKKKEVLAEKGRMNFGGAEVSPGRRFTGFTAKMFVPWAKTHKHTHTPLPQCLFPAGLSERFAGVYKY